MFYFNEIEMFINININVNLKKSICCVNFQNIKGIHCLVKRFREKNKEMYPTDIFLCRRSAVWHGANLCMSLRKDISSAGRACGANIWLTPPGESQKYFFSCCAGRPRGSIVATQARGPHNRQNSEIFLLCRRSMRH